MSIADIFHKIITMDILPYLKILGLAFIITFPISLIHTSRAMCENLKECEKTEQ